MLCTIPQDRNRNKCEVEAAQDIASEALRRLLEEFHAGRAPDHLAAWLYRVTCHTDFPEVKRTGKYSA